MQVHANPASAEGHSFDLQTEALFLPVFARESDSAAGTHYPMPRQPVGPLQGPYRETCCTRESGSFRHLAVRDDFSARDAGDHCSKLREPGHPAPLFETG